MVGVEVGAEQVGYLQVVGLDIGLQRLFLLLVVASRINHYGFARFVGEHVAVYGEHIEFKSLDFHSFTEYYVKGLTELWAADSEGNVNHLLGLKEGLLEVVAQVSEVGAAFQRIGFTFQLAPLQANQSVRQGVLLLGGDVLADNLDQVGQRHHGTAYYEVELALLLLSPLVGGSYVLQSDSLRYLASHAHLLADAIYQVEMHLGEEDGQGNAGEAAACT